MPQRRSSVDHAPMGEKGGIKAEAGIARIAAQETELLALPRKHTCTSEDETLNAAVESLPTGFGEMGGKATSTPYGYTPCRRNALKVTQNEGLTVIRTFGKELKTKLITTDSVKSSR
eukprot:6173775-Pleurochrysis_carterae.AAC.4